jgi:hypothetical protein
MKTAAGRFLLIFCLSATSLWAQHAGIDVQKPGDASVNTGPAGMTGSGDSTGLGSGSLQQQSVDMSGTPLGTVTTAPKVDVGQPVTAPQVAPNSLTAPQEQAPAQAATATQPRVDKAVSPAALGMPGQAASSRKAGVDPGAGQALETGTKDIQQGAADEAAGMGEMAVHQALDRIFDASRASMSQGQGIAGISGAQVSIEDKIKKTVALANTSSPRSAPDLYVSAIKTAEDSLPASMVSMINAAVLDYASRKALTALPGLANEAYDLAAAGAQGEVKKSFLAFDKWEKLLGAPGRPLVANMVSLKSDIERVLGEGVRAMAAGRRSLAPHIWFSRLGPSFNAVLPSASLASVPTDFAERLTLKDAVIAVPFYQQALMAFQARPSLANGLRLVYQANRGENSSSVGSAYAAASYGVKAFLARLWHAVRDFVLRLAGRAPAADIGQGFSVTPSAALAKPARIDTVSLAGAHLQTARVEAPLPAWRKPLQAVNALQTEHALAEAVLFRDAPLDMQAARALLGLASVMAANHAVIMGEDSASVVVRDISARLEQMAREDGLGPTSPLTAAMVRLVRDPEGGSLRQWLDRIQSSGQERVLAISGQAQANLLLSRRGGASWALADLGEKASTAKGRIAGSGLRAAAKLFLDSVAAPQGSFVVMDQVLLGRWDDSQGRGKVLAVLAPAAQGGGIRILHENPAGAASAAKILNGLGFAVETRGQALSAFLSASASDAALAATLSQAVIALQTGRTPQAAGYSAARGESAAAVRKLVSDLKRQKASAAAVAQVLQSAAPEAMRLVTIGRVEGAWAQSGRLVLDDGRTLTATLLKDQESGLFTAARAQVNGPGGKSRALTAAELDMLLRGE